MLFVICLVLRATTLSMLAWRVTGFTTGHSVTLALGFFGYVPKRTGRWCCLESGPRGLDRDRDLISGIF